MLGFQGTDPTLIASAISELARNIVQYAGQGKIVLRIVNRIESRLRKVHEQLRPISDSG